MSPTHNCNLCNTPIPVNMKTCPGCFSNVVKRRKVDQSALPGLTYNTPLTKAEAKAASRKFKEIHGDSLIALEEKIKVKYGTEDIDPSLMVPPAEPIESQQLREALDALPLEDRKQALSCRDRIMAIAREYDHLGLLALGMAAMDLDGELRA